MNVYCCSCCWPFPVFDEPYRDAISAIQFSISSAGCFGGMAKAYVEIYFIKHSVYLLACTLSFIPFISPGKDWAVFVSSENLFWHFLIICQIMSAENVSCKVTILFLLGKVISQGLRYLITLALSSAVNFETALKVFFDFGNTAMNLKINLRSCLIFSYSTLELMMSQLRIFDNWSLCNYVFVSHFKDS